MCTKLRAITNARSQFGLIRPHRDIGVNEVGKELAERITAQEFSQAHIDCLVVSSEMGNANWKGLRGSITRALAGNSGTSAEQAIVLLDALEKLTIHPKASIASPTKENLKSLAEDGSLLHWLGAFSAAGLEPDIEAFVLLELLKHNPTLEIPGEVGNSEAGKAYARQCLNNTDEGWVSSFAQQVGKQDAFPVLLPLWRALPKMPPLATESIRIASQGELRCHLVTAASCAERHANIKRALTQDEFAELLRKLNTEDNLCTHVMSEDFSTDASGLYLDLVHLKLGEPEFNSWAVSGLHKLKEPEWSILLGAPEWPLRLFITLATEDHAWQLGPAFQDAVVNYARLVSKGTEDSSGELIAIKPLSNFIASDDTRRKLQCELVGVACQMQDGEIPVRNFFDLFGEEISVHEALAEDERLVDALFIGILKNGDTTAMNWLAAVLQENPQLLTLPRNGVDNFVERVRDSVGDEEIADIEGPTKQIAEVVFELFPKLEEGAEED